MDVKGLAEHLPVQMDVSNLTLPSQLSEALESGERIPITCLEVTVSPVNTIDGYTAIELLGAIDESLAVLTEARTEILDRWQQSVDAHLNTNLQND